MIESHPRSAFVRFAAIAVACVALLVFHACSDATGPGSRAHAHGARLAFNPVFQTTNGTVQFEKVHILLHRTDGSVALDTLISFPADADELTLSFEVPFSLSADASGENFVLNLEMLNAAGDVVYRGGPIQVHAAAAGTAAPPPVDIPTTYTGPGATATRVEILPGALTVSPNAIVNFTATAFDESGAVLPGTPIQFSSLDPAIATVPDPTLARVVAGLARGTARIRATTVTGKTADALLTVRPAAVSVALDAGNAQSGTVATTLPVPLRVKVLASDGLGIDGTVVTFAITNGSGTLGAAQITTDAQGLAGTTLTLPNTPGTVTVTATASGLTGSPVTFTATATSGAASQLVFAQQPANGTTGITLPLITVQARDVQGNLTTGFTGQVTLALDNPPAGVTLQGTTAVAAVGGVASFADVRVSGVASGLRLRASAAGIANVTLSNTFNIAPTNATQLVLTSPAPVGKHVGDAISFVVEARSAQGLLVPTQQGLVLAAITSGPPGGAFAGPTAAAFTSGVATFGLTFTVAGSYQIAFGASGLQGTTTAVFVITPAAAATVQPVSGNGQTGSAGAPLTNPLVVRVADDFGAPVAGVTVTWSVTSGGGSVLPATSTTNANGLASASWTLGLTGPQAVTATVPGLAAASFTATLGGGAVVRTWLGASTTSWSDSTSWSPAGVPGAADNVVIPSGTPFSPEIFGSTSIHSLSLLAGAQLTINASDLQLTGNLSLGANAFVGTTFSSLRAGIRSAPMGQAAPRRVTAALRFGYGTLTMAGPGTITAASGAFIDPDVFLNGATTMVTDAEFGGSLIVQNSGALDISGHHVIVHMDFGTTGSGTLTMNLGGAVLEVFGMTSFSGGSTTGLLTAGTLLMHGSFSQFGETGSEIRAGVRTTSLRSMADAAATATRASTSARLRRSGVPFEIGAAARLSRSAAARSRIRAAVPQHARAVSGGAGAALIIANTVGASPSSFDASGAFLARFQSSCTLDCGTDGSIFFETPATAHFQHVTIDGGLWRVEGNAPVTGNLSLVNSSSLTDVEIGTVDVFGTVSVASGSAITVSTLIVFHDPTGAGIISPSVIDYAGTSHSLSQVTVPGLTPSNVFIAGNAALVSGESFMVDDGSVFVIGSGQLDINGATLHVVTGDFATIGSGRLIMDGTNDLLHATNASFGGGASTITAGAIHLFGSLSQSGGAADAFSASGSNIVMFNSAAAGILMDNAGTGAGTSHFANLGFDGATTLNLFGPAYVTGVLSAADGLGAISIASGGETLHAEGLQVNGSGTSVTFDRTALAVGPGGAITAFNNVLFQGFTSTDIVTQLTLSRSSGSYTFDSIHFSSLCANTSVYILAADGDGIAPNPSYTFTNSAIADIANCPGKRQTAGGASLGGL